MISLAFSHKGLKLFLQVLSKVNSTLHICSQAYQKAFLNAQLPLQQVVASFDYSYSYRKFVPLNSFDQKINNIKQKLIVDYSPKLIQNSLVNCLQKFKNSIPLIYQIDLQNSMPQPGQKRSKTAISQAAISRSKSVRKKWTKERNKEKVNNAVFLDEKLQKQIDTQITKLGLMVTVSVLVDKFKINGSVARQVLSYYAQKGVLVPVGDQNKQQIYTVSAQILADQKAQAAIQAQQKPLKR
ncbi:hypothetical protein pb186bvf_018472 [Paramecium bursaria]